MAELSKCGKRKDKLIISGGGVYVGTHADWRPTKPDGMLRAAGELYDINITGQGGEAYRLSLSQQEMLRVLSEWLQRHASALERGLCRNCKEYSSDIRRGFCTTCREMGAEQ